MSIGLSLAQAADAAGLRRAAALAASLVRRGQSFSVDEEGHWVNRQRDATIVSPSIHTTRYADIERWVLENYTQAYTPSSGDTLVDVGAGVGEEALVFSRLVGPSGRVFAIEAHPETFACLQRSLARSGRDNVTALHCAMADRDGELGMSDRSAHLTNSVLLPGESASTVPARSLDSLVRELGLERIDYLRMNIEGAERLAIAGMAESVGKIRNIFISCHDFVADATGDDSFRSYAVVRPFLEAAGFRVTGRTAETGRPWLAGYLYGARAA
ncbi:MAG TPA: FkbM family methyltransferase [Allosphingosinicella sp.]|jgi:FkbM family methyltransferase